MRRDIRRRQHQSQRHIRRVGIHSPSIHSSGSNPAPAESGSPAPIPPQTPAVCHPRPPSTLPHSPVLAPPSIRPQPTPRRTNIPCQIISCPQNTHLQWTKFKKSAAHSQRQESCAATLNQAGAEPWLKRSKLQFSEGRSGHGRSPASSNHTLRRHPSLNPSSSTNRNTSCTGSSGTVPSGEHAGLAHIAQVTALSSPVLSHHLPASGVHRKTCRRQRHDPSIAYDHRRCDHRLRPTTCAIRHRRCPQLGHCGVSLLDLRPVRHHCRSSNTLPSFCERCRQLHPLHQHRAAASPRSIAGCFFASCQSARSASLCRSNHGARPARRRRFPPAGQRHAILPPSAA